MTAIKTFTLSEANELIPKLKTLLLAANREIDVKAEAFSNAHFSNQDIEKEMDRIRAIEIENTEDESALAELRNCRLKFQESIEELVIAKEEYVDTLNYWLEEISETGVILRDIKSGLLDFPAEAGDFKYYLCWQGNEDKIDYWHLINDGFIGRKPIAVLSEYL